MVVKITLTSGEKQCKYIVLVDEVELKVSESRGG